LLIGVVINVVLAGVLRATMPSSGRQADPARSILALTGHSS